MLQAEAESFPVELSCSGTQCLELFLYFDRTAIPWNVGKEQDKTLVPTRNLSWVSRFMCDFKMHMTSGAPIFIFIMSLSTFLASLLQRFSEVKHMKVLWIVYYLCKTRFCHQMPWVLGAPYWSNIVALPFDYGKSLHVILPSPQNCKILEGKTGKPTLLQWIFKGPVAVLFKWLSQWFLWWSVFITKKMDHHSIWKKKKTHWGSRL